MGGNLASDPLIAVPFASMLRARFFLPFVLVGIAALAPIPASPQGGATQAAGAARPPAVTPPPAPAASVSQPASSAWDKVFPILSSVLASAIFAFLLWWLGKHKTRFAERRAARNPNTIHLWNLIGESVPESEQVIALLRAINRAASRVGEQAGDSNRISREPSRSPSWWRRPFLPVRKIRPSLDKAVRIWEPVAGELTAARHEFVEPVCVISDDGSRRRGDGVAAVRAWLEQCHGRETPESVGRISVGGGGGAGKTIFMHRLLLDLSGGLHGKAEAIKGKTPAVPVPMLASPQTLQKHAEEIRALRTTGDPVRAFVIVWLKNREIELPEDATKSIIREFKHALSDGRIVLLLDGGDELRHQGLGEFGEDLLDGVRYWVDAHRPGSELARTERKVVLADSWGNAEIASHINLRWGKAGAAGTTFGPAVTTQTREMVKKVIAEVLRRHDEAARKSSTRAHDDVDIASSHHSRREPHWLSTPRSLDLYLDAIEQGKLKTEADIRNGAENQPYLFRKILSGAVDKIKTSGDSDAAGKQLFHAIRERLFDVAVTDPTNTRRQPVDRPVRSDDRIGAHLRELTEIVGFSEKHARFYFRHAALRAYFIAGQTARELLEPLHASGPSDELSRDDSWSAAKRAAVESWLNELDEATTDPAAAVAEWLRRDRRANLRLKAGMRRNLLDLLISLELSSGKDRRDITSLSNLDLADNCDFREAGLAGADAVAAVFNDCNFGGDVVDAPDAAKVKGMAIDRAEFRKNGSDAPALGRLLADRGASAERSRYRGEFGRKFFQAQHAFLGPGVEQLESDHYLRAIEEAVSSWIDADSPAPVYLVDLMAGGSYQRVAALREKFDCLHVLGIDRDDATQPLDPPRFKWLPAEIGKRAGPGAAGLGFDIGESLRNAFGSGVSQAHVIVAKKALHELDRGLQPLLIRECARVLRPGGRLILFEDTPGPENEQTDAAALEQVVAKVDSLRRRADGTDGVLVDTDCEPHDVASALAELEFDDSATGRIAFANSWIMLKDWANLNRHEVSHRYFASVTEICQWASAPFGPPRSLSFNNYRLNPLIFNELGIQRVLDHLVREVPKGGDRTPVVERDEAQLAEWIWESARLKVLVEFTRKHLAPGSALANALEAKEESISLETIDPALRFLNRPDITAPSFSLPCAVLVFEKGRAREPSELSIFLRHPG